MGVQFPNIIKENFSKTVLKFFTINPTENICEPRDTIKKVTII